MQTARRIAALPPYLFAEIDKRVAAAKAAGVDVISFGVADQAQILWLNYPSNPTAAVATIDQFERAVRFSADHDLLLAHDNAYSEITYDGFVAPSILEVPGALDVAVEFGSLSKIFNMTGWRIGWVVGSEVVIEALGRVKTNIDS